MSEWNEAIQKMFDETNFEDVKITRKDFYQACKNILKDSYEGFASGPLAKMGEKAALKAFCENLQGRDVDILKISMIKMLNKGFFEFDEVSNVN